MVERNRYTSVWNAVSDSPAEADNMRLRAELINQLRQHITAQGWRQTDAAERLGVTQPRISDLMRGRISQLSIDALIEMASAAGLHFDVILREDPSPIEAKA